MKTYEGHVSPQQGTLLLAAVLMSMLYLQYPEFLVAIGGPAAWQVSLVMTVVAVVLFLPMAGLAGRFPGLGLAEISEEVVGPYLGPLVTLGVVVWLLSSVTLTVRNFTETFIIAMLPQTPPSVLILVIISCAAFASYRGLEALSRATQIFFPLIVAGGLVLILFSLPRVQMALLFPFWGHGVGITLEGGVYAAGMTAEAVILLALGFGFRTGADLRTSGLWAILIFGLLTTVTVAVLIAIFGAPDVAQLPFPLFNLARLIYLGRFFQRTEAVIVLLWFFAAAVRISAVLHAAVVSLSGALRLPFYRPVIFPVSVLVAALSLVPKDFLSVMHFERDLIRPTGIIVLTVPLVLLLVAVLRGKGGQTNGG